MKRIDELVARRNELAAGIDYVRTLLDDDTLPAERFDEGVTYCRETAAEIEKADADIAQLRHIEQVRTDPMQVSPAGGPTVIVQRDQTNPFDVRDMGPFTTRADVRARALTAIEKIRDLGDDMREAATRTIERAIDPTGEVGKRILLTGSDAYRTGFQKALGGNSFGLTDDERDALGRAASLTGNAGGYAVPFTLDPTIILTSSGYRNAIRSMSRVVQITTDQWNGVSSAGVTASYDAEAAEVSDDAPTLAQPSIDVRMARAFVPFSIEIGMDWPSMEAEIRGLIMDAKDNLETTVFWSGASGSNQPIGIETALSGVATSLYTAAGEALVIADVEGLYAACPPRARQSASFGAVAEWSTISKIRGLLAAAADRSSFNEATATTPQTLYGWPLMEHSAVDPYSSVSASATATHHLAVAGDWSQYVIVDRVGMNVELVPHLFATANNLPSGQRGFFAWWRNGADSVNDAQFRVLKLVTSGA